MFSRSGRSDVAAFVLGAVTFASACTIIGTLTFTEKSEEIEIEGDALSDQAGDLFPPDVPIIINLEKHIDEQDAGGARALHLISLEVRMTENTVERDFDFLDTVEVDIAAEDHSRELLAWRDDIPASDSFTMFVDDQLDLKPYVESGVTLLTEVEGIAPAATARFKIVATFEVEVL